MEHRVGVRDHPGSAAAETVIRPVQLTGQLVDDGVDDAGRVLRAVGVRGHLEHDGVREKLSGLRRHDTEGLTPPDEGVEVRGR